MSIKDLFRTFVQSHLTSQKGWVAHQSAPSSEIIDIETPGGQDFQSLKFIPPSDGFVSIYSPSGRDRELKAYSNEGNYVMSGIQLPSANGGAIFIPVRKSSMVLLSATKESTVRFVKLVGGVKSLWHSLFGGLCHA